MASIVRRSSGSRLGREGKARKRELLAVPAPSPQAADGNPTAAEAPAALQLLLDMDADLTADPMDQLRRIFLREDAVQRYLEGRRHLEGLRLAEPE